MADMQIRCSRVKTSLDDQRPTFLKLCFQPVFRQNLLGAASQLGDLFLDITHACWFSPLVNFTSVSASETVASSRLLTP